MKSAISALVLLLGSTTPIFAQSLTIDAGPQTDGRIVLLGPDASRQLVVTGQMPGQHPIDSTRGVSFKSNPDGIIKIGPTGEVTPLANGTTTITASADGLPTASVLFEVQRIETTLPINFPNDVVPLFTKFGCNGGGCHGKSEGQNGFRLSLLGFTPTEDYEYLVKEARGRRIFPASPEHSLLLMKGTGELPHGGGARLIKGSPEYRSIVRWIEQSMPYGSKDDPKVERIEVFPKERVMSGDSEQQIRVTAYYSDGSTADVTRTVQYEANDKEMAECSQSGLVKVGSTPGSVGVMIRFQELVDVYQAVVPLGAPMGERPPDNNFIDTLVYKKLETLGLPPSELCDDTTFLRRTSVDIAGRLPTPEEANTFAASQDSNKRAKWIDQLLASNEYADTFANKWSALLRNKRSGANAARSTNAFHQWIRDSFHENKPYSQFTSELITASGEVSSNPAVSWFRNVDKKQEQLQDIAQVFLGVRLQCAQCHHHPYEKWSQDDYYGFSAFFTQVGRKPGGVLGEPVVYHKRGVAQDNNPKTKLTLKPTPLGGEPIQISARQDPRRNLAAWMTKENNPFFARMLVNRYWKHFTGRGLVEPEDDIRITNPATNEALLAAMEKHFVDSNYDLKDLIRTICNSRTYQLSATPNEHNQNDKQNYSRYYPKRLLAEVLLDSIDVLTDVPTKFNGLPSGVRAVQLPDDSFNSSSYFLTVFGKPEMDSACECERSGDANLAQSLHLLNSKGLQDKLSNGSGRATRLSQDKSRSDMEKLNELYLIAFSRPPSSEENKFALDYIDAKRKSAGEDAAKLTAMEKEAYEDLVWALINTKEFLFNH